METISPSSGWISLSKNSSFPTSEAAWQKQSRAWKHTRKQFVRAPWGTGPACCTGETALPVPAPTHESCCPKSRSHRPPHPALRPKEAELETDVSCPHHRRRSQTPSAGRRQAPHLVALAHDEVAPAHHEATGAHVHVAPGLQQADVLLQGRRKRSFNQHLFAVLFPQSHSSLQCRERETSPWPRREQPAGNSSGACKKCLKQRPAPVTHKALDKLAVRKHWVCTEREGERTRV